MNCIILGDKYQKGMKSKGCAGLIKITNRQNIIENQYFVLKSIFDNINLVYIYGFDNKKFLDFICDSNMNIVTIYNDKYNRYNHVFSLGLVQELFNDDVLIIDGYEILTKKIFKKFNSTDSGVFVSSSFGHDAVGCVINKDGNIENFNFDLTNSLQNIYYLNKRCAIATRNILKNHRYCNYFIFEILNQLIDNGYVFKPHFID